MSSRNKEDNMKFWKALSPGLRDILTLLAVLAIFFGLGLLSGPAHAEPLALPLPPEVQARCDAAGGCALVTEAQLVKALQEAFNDGARLGQVMATFEAQEAAKKQAQDCRRGEGA
jgi:hypothetical protein